MNRSESSKLRKEDLGMFRAGSDIKLRRTAAASPPPSAGSLSRKTPQRSSSNDLDPPAKRRKLEDSSSDSSSSSSSSSSTDSDTPPLRAATTTAKAKPKPNNNNNTNKVSTSAAAQTSRHQSSTASSSSASNSPNTRNIASAAAVVDDNQKNKHSKNDSAQRDPKTGSTVSTLPSKTLSVDEIAAAERQGSGDELMHHFVLPRIKVSAYSLALISQLWEVRKIEGANPNDLTEPQWTLIPKPTFAPPQPQKQAHKTSQSVNAAFNALVASSGKSSKPKTTPSAPQNPLNPAQTAENDAKKRVIKKAVFTPEQDKIIIAEMEPIPPAQRNTAAVLKKISELTGHKPTAIAFRYFNSLDPSSVKGLFTEKEDALIIETCKNFPPRKPVPEEVVQEICQQLRRNAFQLRSRIATLRERGLLPSVQTTPQDS